MGLYSHPQTQLITDLINEANPGLNIDPLTVSNCDLGTPIAITPKEGDIGDTSLLLTPKPGYFFKGPGRVTYRRIDLNRLFNNEHIRIDIWDASNQLTNENLMGIVNQRYSLNLLAVDINRTGIRNNERVVMPIHPDSLCYKGGLPVHWVKGKRDLTQVFPQDVNFNIRTYSNRQIDNADTRPLLTHLHYGYDFSQFGVFLNTLSNGQVTSNTTNALVWALRHLTDITDVSLTVSEPHTTLGGLAGLTINKYTRPFTALSDADPNFNTVICINAETDSWFSGRLLLHFNVT
jgi:hypothetical protein